MAPQNTHSAEVDVVFSLAAPSASIERNVHPAGKVSLTAIPSSDAFAEMMIVTSTTAPAMVSSFGRNVFTVRCEVRLDTTENVAVVATALP